MKKTVLLLILIINSFVLFSQSVGSGLQCLMSNKNNAKSGVSLFADRFSFLEINGERYVSLIAKIANESTVSDLERMGCKVYSRSGDIITLRAKEETLEDLIHYNGLLKIETARKTTSPLLDDAIEDINADYVHQGLELPQGFDGEGVIIGIADWGFDYTHPVFYDTLMQDYRVIAAWDQYRLAGNPPEGFDYGSEIVGKDALLAAQCDTNNIYDRGYHGTHVASIAAGGGASTQYKGVAYGAQLLFATWLIDEAAVLDAYTWMKNVAKAQNKRLVVNNSWGIYHFGYMDGSSMFDEFVYNMSQEDSVVFVSSAGNNGGSKFHLKAHFDSRDTVRSEIRFDLPQSSSDDYWGQTITMVGDSLQEFSAKLELYSNNWELLNSTEWLTSNGSVLEESFFVFNETDSLVYRASSAINQSNERPLMEWEVGFTNPNSVAHVVLVVTAENGNVHAWNVACLTTGVGNWGLPFEWHGYGYISGDSEYAIGEPAIGQGMIAVAAHKSGRRNSSSAVSNLASFSSAGPNLCPYQKPEISAPGVLVVSAISSFATEPPEYSAETEFNSKTYGFAALSGTSMSSPAVSGIAALVLQANPNLTPSQVREILTSTAYTDRFTGEVPNVKWGYGKANAWQAVKKANQLVGMEQINADSHIWLYPNPAGDFLFINTNLRDCMLLSITDLTGREVMSLNRKTNGIDISNLAAGSYLLRIKDESKILTIKFVKQ